ncbi:ATP-dependent DNA helicase PIF6-like [Microplitis demolitor]|uniref:ATP-dependent DNA helicase PIF6-like n=1 Tax=Microplitis demolitor TaxID=69319 RepID=UPI00235B6455|nr:ATP-dependent DNA helicase PIF6-like [Microplitis demolitor]
MRVHQGGDPISQKFSNLLLDVGGGNINDENGEVSLPDELCSIVPSIEDLIEKVYPGIKDIKNKEDSWLSERAILCPKNEMVVRINNTIIDKFDANEMVYASINTTINPDDATNYTVDFLNSISVPGLPSHTIKLKIGAPIILLRNLNPPQLCNGTRLRVTKLQKNVIEATILTGSGKGESVFIPRIPLIPNNFPFEFKRIQFPVSLSFTMTINKAQGQTMSITGVDLRTPCFSHGQLYVSLSRVRSNKNVYVCVNGEKTRNVVYTEVLN